MMFENYEEFFSKMDWEGGLDYIIRETQPEDYPEDSRIRALLMQIQPLYNELTDLAWSEPEDGRIP